MENYSTNRIPPVKLNLDDSLLLNPGEVNESNSSLSVSFVNFIDRLFRETLSDVPYVDEITLNCAKKRYDDAKIVSWISAALGLNVRLLDLIFSLNESRPLFHSLNGCTMLVRLWLTLDSELHIPDDFCLPNLESLMLLKLSVDEENGASINELIKGCPALKGLSLSGCDFRLLETLYIKSPLITRMLIENSLFLPGFKVILNVPNLRGLIYNDCVAASYSLCQFKCLLTAQIDVGPSEEQLDEIDEDSDDDDDLWYYDEVANLVWACSSTIHLHLAACSLAALRYSSVPLPVFQNLIWLSLGCLGVHWELLAFLLVNAPCLEKLTLEEGFDKNEDGFAIFQNSLSGPPSCLELHLKIIDVWVCNKEESEIKILEYFLKNCKALEKLLLPCFPLDDTSIISRLFRIPRQSKSCYIYFGTKYRTDDM